MLPYTSVLGLVASRTGSAVLREAARLRAATGGTLYVDAAPGAAPSTLADCVRAYRKENRTPIHCWTTTGRRAGGTTSLVVVEGGGAEVLSHSDVRHAVYNFPNSSVFVMAPSTTPGTIQRILVPTDFSAAAREGVRQAVALADLYDARVTLLHVIEKSPYVALTSVDRLSMGRTALPEHRAERNLRKCIQAQKPTSVPLDFETRVGTAADQIGRAAARGPYDLLVLASHGEEGTRALGSVAEAVLCRVQEPLVLVRMPETASSSDNE